MVELKLPESAVTSSNGAAATNGHATNGHATNGNGQVAADSNKPTDTGRLNKRWINVGTVDDFPKDGGSTIKYGDVQIAVYNFASRGQWYACQNMCPHKNAFVLSRGIIGTAGEQPKVSCPLHKKPFSLETGESLSGEDFSLKVFPVRIDGNDVLVELPPEEQLNALLATDLHRIGECDAQQAAACGSCS